MELFSYFFYFFKHTQKTSCRYALYVCESHVPANIYYLLPIFIIIIDVIIDIIKVIIKVIIIITIIIIIVILILIIVLLNDTNKGNISSCILTIRLSRLPGAITLSTLVYPCGSLSLKSVQTTKLVPLEFWVF